MSIKIIIEDENEPLTLRESENKIDPKIRELIKAVAHIGVDFGYGKYELEDKHIEVARNWLKINPASKP